MRGPEREKVPQRVGIVDLDESVMVAWAPSVAALRMSLDYRRFAQADEAQEKEKGATHSLVRFLTTQRRGTSRKKYVRVPFIRSPISTTGVSTCAQ
jgi:hypothetical protein